MKIIILDRDKLKLRRSEPPQKKDDFWGEHAFALFFVFIINVMYCMIVVS